MREFRRKTYKDVKKMDRAAMEAFLKAIAEESYEKGREEAYWLSEAEVKEAALTIKGIGIVKAEALIGALKGAIRRKAEGGMDHGRKKSVCGDTGFQRRERADIRSRQGDAERPAVREAGDH